MLSIKIDRSLRDEVEGKIVWAQEGCGLPSDFYRSGALSPISIMEDSCPMLERDLWIGLGVVSPEFRRMFDDDEIELSSRLHFALMIMDRTPPSS